jgi:hypothetical protein
MYRTSAITVALLLLATSANAQMVSNDMSCEEAKAYYAEHGMIQTRDGDQVLPIDNGVPAEKRGELQCEQRGDVSLPVFVTTSDMNECAIAYACED